MMPTLQRSRRSPDISKPSEISNCKTFFHPCGATQVINMEICKERKTRNSAVSHQQSTTQVGKEMRSFIPLLGFDGLTVLGYGWSIMGHSRCRDIWKVGAEAKHPHLHKPTPSQIYRFGASFHSPIHIFHR